MRDCATQSRRSWVVADARHSWGRKRLVLLPSRGRETRLWIQAQNHAAPETWRTQVKCSLSSERSAGRRRLKESCIAVLTANNIWLCQKLLELEKTMRTVKTVKWQLKCLNNSNDILRMVHLNMLQMFVNLHDKYCCYNILPQCASRWDGIRPLLALSSDIQCMCQHSNINSRKLQCWSMTIDPNLTYARFFWIIII